jgi:hypothetical protein
MPATDRRGTENHDLLDVVGSAALVGASIAVGTLGEA